MHGRPIPSPDTGDHRQHGLARLVGVELGRPYERTTAAYESKTWGDLRMLTADLPSQPILGGDVPGRIFRSDVSPDARLPSHPPRASLPTPSSRRRGSPIPFLIPLVVWIILAMHTASGGGAAVVVALLVGTVVLMSAVRRR